MRSRTLIEADYDFSQHTADVLDKVSKLAGGAYGSLKAGYQKSKAEAEAAKKKAEAEAAKQGKAPVEDMLTTAANLIITTRATPDDIKNLNLNASQLQDFAALLKELDKHVDSLPAIFKKALVASELISADQRDEISQLLGDQRPTSVQIGDKKIEADRHGEQDTWHRILVSKDPAEIGKALVDYLLHMQRENERINLGNHPTLFKRGAKVKMQPTGLGLINVAAGERQAIKMRLKDLRDLVASVEKHPQLESIQRLASKARTRL